MIGSLPRAATRSRDRGAALEPAANAWSIVVVRPI